MIYTPNPRRCPSEKKPGRSAKTALLFLSTIYNTIRLRIVPAISAICFRDFTSEKWWKSGNYARFFANYARNPGPDDASWTRSGSYHRRRTENRICSIRSIALRLLFGLHRKRWCRQILPYPPSCPWPFSQTRVQHKIIAKIPGKNAH